MYPSLRQKLPALLLGLMVFIVPQASALDVRFMDLEELCDRADKVFRGTVFHITEGTVSIGGTELPTLTYKVEVSEVFKGNIPVVKDGVRVVEVTMLGTVKPAAPNGTIRAFSKLPELPRFEVGQDYVLMTTAPSSAGLSTTVGLGQGSFRISTANKAEMAINELGNQGLFDGPVAYTTLADEISSLLGQ